MKFVIPSEVRLVSLKEITTKTDKKMTFATIANVETFETLETRLALTAGQAMTEIAEGKNYRAIVEYDGQYGSVTLAPLVPAVPQPKATKQ